MSGSEYPQGPGWWQASDGRFYPPPNPAEQQVPPAPQMPQMPQYMATPGQMPPTPGGLVPKGFFGSLFDLSFSKFITPSIIKVLFILAITLWSLYALFIFVAVAQQGGPVTLIGVLVVPLLWLLGVVYSRVMLEVVMVLFAIEKNTRDSR